MTKTKIFFQWMVFILGLTSFFGCETSSTSAVVTSKNWFTISSTGAPSPRTDGVVVWTGREMIVWGGGNGATVFADGRRYSFDTGVWTTMSTTDAPSARKNPHYVWTGERLIIWGGLDGNGNPLGDGALYDPADDTWSAVGITGTPPSARAFGVAVWTGKEMIIWGGQVSGGAVTDTGYRYNPSASGTWTAMTTTSPPTARRKARAIWNGEEMIVWGGQDNGGLALATGGIYKPYDSPSDSWSAVSATNAPSARMNHAMVWTGQEVIVWGGFDGVGDTLSTGGRYNPSTNQWLPTANANAPGDRENMWYCWTGKELLVWGGYSQTSSGVYSNGGRYNPFTSTWNPISNFGIPLSARQNSESSSCAALWTGSSLLVWGGKTASSSYFGSGAEYKPYIDEVNTWDPIGVSNAPVARTDHVAVWTGCELIVWGGGTGGTAVTNTGGRYNPSTKVWIPMTTTGPPGAPSARKKAQYAWTGRRLIVWGGVDGSDAPQNDGAIYNPSTNSWSAAISGTSAPSARSAAAQVWTGCELILWGGSTGGTGVTNTGARYNPVADTWTALGATGFPPTGRRNSQAVWTGREMIVWGGDDGATTPTPFGDGARYDPANDTWATVNATGSSARRGHRMIWTGREMIVWGGDNGMGTHFSDGDYYSPKSDTWSTLSNSGLASRSFYWASWTGRGMLVWGGETDSAFSNDGRKYNLYTNLWTAITSTGAPSARRDGGERQIPIWTGYGMVVWGGEDGTGVLNSGSIYVP